MNNVTLQFPFKLEIYSHYFVISDEELNENIILNRSKIIRIKYNSNEIQILSECNSKVILDFDEEKDAKNIFTCFKNCVYSHQD